MHPLDAVYMMRETTSRIEKKNLLQHIPTPYLVWTYSPQKRFYLTLPTVQGIGPRTLDGLTDRLLTVLSDRNLSGKDARRATIKYLMSLRRKDAAFLQLVLKKNFGCGIGPKTINEVYPDLIPESNCMLAELFDESRVLFPCWADPKIDGIRADYDNGYLYTRNGSVIRGYDHITTAIRKAGITIPLTGELRDPTIPFEKSSGKSRRTKHLDNKNEVFFVFDTPIPGKTAILRYAMLEAIQWPDNVIYVKKTLIRKASHIGVLYEWCLNNGYEGLMVKSYAHEYRAGRSFDWMKIKPVDALDLRVRSLLEGKGKWKGMLGKAVVKFKGNTVFVTPAMTDELKRYYFEHPNEILDHYIEVHHQGVTNGGKSLRHPRFSVVRKDK